jgi:DNA-directed RNA polymerase subunit M/transcription elongation factor TFIIS
MTDHKVYQELTQRMTAAIVFARNAGISEVLMRNCFDRVMLHVTVLNLAEAPPIHNPSRPPRNKKPCCPACGHKRSENWSRIPGGGGKSTRYFKCCSCGHAFDMESNPIHS